MQPPDSKLVLFLQVVRFGGWLRGLWHGGDRGLGPVGRSLASHRQNRPVWEILLGISVRNVIWHW